MKPNLFAIAILLPVALGAAPPLEIELVAPPEQPVLIDQEKLDAVAAVAKAAEEREELMKISAKRKLGAEEWDKFERLEATIEEGRALEQGVSLKLRFKNTGDKPVIIRYGSDSSTNFLTVEGPGALDLPFLGGMTADYREAPQTRIEAGRTREFPIEGLRYGARDMSRWLIGEPGTYTVSLRCVIRVGEEITHIGGEEIAQRIGVNIRGEEKIELETDKVTFEVRAGK